MAQVLSSRPHLLYDYFKQRFAQVTNPPIDPIREGLVMSLEMRLGKRGNLLQPGPNAYHQVQSVLLAMVPSVVLQRVLAGVLHTLNRQSGEDEDDTWAQARAQGG